MNITITPHVIMLRIYRLVLFTYIDENQLIGYYIHRTDTKQFTGHAWNPHTGKVSTFKK